MSYSGMPTPDEQLPQTYRCVQIFVPDSVGDEFFSVIMGQLGEMAKDWYWKQEGTLTPEQAAFLMAQSTAMTDANGIECEEIMACADLDDCIENNITTQITINQMLLSLGIVNPDRIEPVTPQMENRLPTVERQEEVSPPPPTCDKDELWAGILEMVTRIDELALDFLQDVVSYNDRTERIANIIDIVPIFGDVAADIITVFSDIAPDLRNAYVAHSSQQVLEETACALFEMVCNECRYPTYDELFDHYSNAGVSGMDDIVNYGVTALMDYFTASNNLGNAVVWYTIQTGVLYTLYLGSTFGNRRGLKWLDIWASIGEESPSAAWEILCDGCEDTWCQYLDYRVEEFGLVTLDYQGSPVPLSWVDGFGWQGGFVGGISYYILAIEAFTLSDVTKITAVVDWGGSNESASITVYGVLSGGGTEVIAFDSVNGINQLYTLVWSGTKQYEGVVIWCAQNLADTKFLQSFKIEGTGISPFGVDNC